MGLDFKTDPTSDRADSLAQENKLLRAEAEQLKHALADRTDRHDRTGKALVRSSAECDALRLEVARLTCERDAITRLLVVESLARGDGWYVQEDLPPKVKGRYPTFEAAVAVIRKAAGMDAAPAGESNPEPGWLDRGFKAIQEDSKTWPAWMKRDAAPADEGGAP
jgi:cell division septum initiation protein DivIVA